MQLINAAEMPVTECSPNAISEMSVATIQQAKAQVNIIIDTVPLIRIFVSFSVVMTLFKKMNHHIIK